MESLSSLKVPVDYVETRKQRRDKAVYGFMRGFLTPEASARPREVAYRFLSSNDDQLGNVMSKSRSLGDVSEEQLVVDSEKRTPAGYHVRFQQLHDGLPVIGAGASVHMTSKRQVHMAVNDIARDVPVIDVADLSAKGLSEKMAIARAIKLVHGKGRLRAKPQARRVLYRTASDVHLAWQVILALQAAMPQPREPDDRASSWQIYLDVASGEVLAQRNILARASGMGKVFYPNPVVALRDNQLKPDAVFQEYAYEWVTLSRLSGSGYLTGKYISTRLTQGSRAREDDLQFLYDRDDPRFEEVMVYYWIDSIASYLQSLGFKNVLTSPIPVNARGTEDDQSWYDPSSGELNFGLGGINDAEDADIILHEFGHLYLDALVPGWGYAWYGAPVRAMGEGIGDFLACAYLADIAGSFQPEVVGDWDAIVYSDDVPPALRRVDGEKTAANVIGQGTVTGLTENTLSDNLANWVPGALEALWITPNARPMGHPAYWPISQNTNTTVTVNLPPGASLLTHGSVGDTYSGEEHEDGEFWSAVLWDIFLGLGGADPSAKERREAAAKAVKLVLTAHKYLDDPDRDSVQFGDAVEALLEADRFVWGEPQDPGPNAAMLQQVCESRKLA